MPEYHLPAYKLCESKCQVSTFPAEFCWQLLVQLNKDENSNNNCGMQRESVPTADVLQSSYHSMATTVL